MNNEIKEILDKLKDKNNYISHSMILLSIKETTLLLDCITNLQEENTIKDTNWESLKYYLEKLYYKDYIEEPIFDDIDKKIKELESKVEIKGYQKEIKHLQKENKILKENAEHNDKVVDKAKWNEMIYKSRNENAIEKIKKIQENAIKYGADHDASICQDLLDILQGEDNNENK